MHLCGALQQRAGTPVPAPDSLQAVRLLIACSRRIISSRRLQLVAANRTVVAAVRDPVKAEGLFHDASGSVAIEAADVTDPASFSDNLWQGVTQVVSAVGPTFQRTEEGPKCAPHVHRSAVNPLLPPSSVRCWPNLPAR